MWGQDFLNPTAFLNAEPEFLRFCSSFKYVHKEFFPVFHLSPVINWILVVLTVFLAPGTYCIIYHFNQKLRT